MERTAPTYAALTSATNVAWAPMAVFTQSAGAASAAARSKSTALLTICS